MGTVVASFVYVRRDSEPIARVDRIEPGRNGRGKEFLPFLTDRKGDFCKKPGLEGMVLPLYHLNEVHAAIESGNPIYIVEGEGKGDELRAMLRSSGSSAAVTTLQGGASAPLRDIHLIPFEGATDIRVIADSDRPGRKAAAKRAQAIAEAYPDCAVRVVDLYPNRSDGSDVRDFIVAGGRVAEFEGLRSKADVILAATLPEQSEPKSRQTQADQAVRLMDELNIELAHDSANVPYARVSLKSGRRAVYQVRSSSFKSFMSEAFYLRFGKTLKRASLDDARNMLEGRAVHAGPLVEVPLRIAGDKDMIDIDLGDDTWQMVRVTADGWSILAHGERWFRRAAGMMALPKPTPGGKFSEIAQFVRVTADSYSLLAAFLVTALCPWGPYLILILEGEQGSAKTTTARILRKLIDPNRADVRAEPRELRDLAIAANNGWVVALDNLSHLTPQMSDALCRLSTGGGFATRTLYTDEDETIFEGKRPSIITSIVDVVNKPDLLDRCLIIQLPPIPESERQTERELWAKFDEVWPRLFGALLDAASTALRDLPKVAAEPKLRPRMADAFDWSLAAAPSIGVDRDILTNAWRRIIEDANNAALESSPIAAALRQLVEDSGGEWSGTQTKLLDWLNGTTDDATRRRQDWPKTPNALTRALSRIDPALRASGLGHSYHRNSNHRLHTFTLRNGEPSPESSFASKPSYNGPSPGECGDDYGF